jgi:hypothetical protein
MKKYDITISTSQAFKLEIEASTEQAAIEKANLLSMDEIVEQSYDYSEVDGFPMVVSVEEVGTIVDNRIEKVEQKDIESNEQVMELADDIFSDYVEAHPEEEDKLQFWNEEEGCGNDTELGSELYEYIRNSLEDKSDVFHKDEDEYFGFVKEKVA